MSHEHRRVHHRIAVYASLDFTRTRKYPLSDGAEAPPLIENGAGVLFAHILTLEYSETTIGSQNHAQPH